MGSRQAAPKSRKKSAGGHKRKNSLRKQRLSEEMFGAHYEMERAVQELRRGMPILLVPPKGTASLIAASELVSARVLDAMRSWCGDSVHILLTHNRAKTLRIRLYTDEFVAVPLREQERAATVHALCDPTKDLSAPLSGPWHARRETLPATAAAAIKIVKLAGLLPSVVVASLRGAVVKKLQQNEGLLSIKSTLVEQYDPHQALSDQLVAHARLPLQSAHDTRVIAFRPSGGGREHLALVVGQPEPPGPVLVRLHSECLTGDLLASLKCDCGDQLRGALAAINAEKSGVLLYLAQEGRGIGLINKLKAYQLQDQGFDTIDANERLGFEADEREFAIAARILKRLGFQSVRLLTNNPDKVAALVRHGIEVTERVAHSFPANPHNEAYLATKKSRAGHLT